MKSMKQAANFKMRGKITMRCHCRCCEVFNPKWAYRMKMAAKDIKELL